MPATTEVKVENAAPPVPAAPAKTPMKTETTPAAMFGEFFTLAFPFSRFFGMTPFAFRPFMPTFREFNDEMNRMLGTFATTEAPAAWIPTMDVHRADGNLIVTAELPGLKKEEVKVEMTKDALIIAGERTKETTEEKEGFHRVERNFGKFYRAVPIPEGANREAIKAELADGVLKITLPVAMPKPAATSIPIQTH